MELKNWIKLIRFLGFKISWSCLLLQHLTVVATEDFKAKKIMNWSRRKKVKIRPKNKEWTFPRFPSFQFCSKDQPDTHTHISEYKTKGRNKKLVNLGNLSFTSNFDSIKDLKTNNKLPETKVKKLSKARSKKKKCLDFRVFHFVILLWYLSFTLNFDSSCNWRYKNNKN